MGRRIRDLRYIEEIYGNILPVVEKLTENSYRIDVYNRNGHNLIIFQKNGVDIPINNLSSGEKQIVYRGCFLLKDANALNGAFVFFG